MKNTLTQAFANLFARTWFQQALFWVGMFAMFSLFRSLRPGSLPLSWQTLIMEVIPMSGVVVSVYFNLKIFIPRLLIPKQYVGYAAGLLLLTFANALLVFLGFELVSPWLGDIAQHPHPTIYKFIPAYMVFQIIFTLISSFFQFVRENSRLNEIALSVTEIESNRLRAELNSLKAQINPHFMFNTLNNIYSYSLFKSEKTPEMILKLSNLMNYIIYECQADMVSLAKEVEFIENYIELEKLRVEDSLTIDLHLLESMEDHRIAPLLFVPFLENAFKHGASVRHDNPSIHIELFIDDEKQLHFTTKNLVDESPETELPEHQGGIGLENIRKRLELIYPGKYSLMTGVVEDHFIVNLSIDLNP